MKYVFVLDYYSDRLAQFRTLGVFTTYELAEEQIPLHEVDEYYTIMAYKLDEKQVKEF